jgi:hypothetical protein
MRGTCGRYMCEEYNSKEVTLRDGGAVEAWGVGYPL